MNNLRFQLLLVIGSFFIATSTAHAHGEGDHLGRIVFLTEEYPPANFRRNGELSGYAIDLLRAASEELGEDIDKKHIVLRPWPDAYKTVLTTENTALFSMSRTKHRESLFQWVGPIADGNIVILARRDTVIEITTPLDVAKYKIGVIQDDIGEQLLLEAGVPRGAMLEAKSVNVLAELLIKNRVDLIAYSEKAAYWYVKQAGLSSDLFKAVYTLKEGNTYYAFNKDTDPVFVQKLQQGIDKLKARVDENGVSQHQAILDKYR
jgi:ABC-type amino acid transport substrate-binding protein